MTCAGHGEMQSDKDHVLQFAGQKSNECSFLQLVLLLVLGLPSYEHTSLSTFSMFLIATSFA